MEPKGSQCRRASALCCARQGPTDRRLRAQRQLACRHPMFRRPMRAITLGRNEKVPHQPSPAAFLWPDVVESSLSFDRFDGFCSFCFFSPCPTWLGFCCAPPPPSLISIARIHRTLNMHFRLSLLFSCSEHIHTRPSVSPLPPTPIHLPNNLDQTHPSLLHTPMPLAHVSS